MEAASTIIFVNDEDLNVQSTALQSYLLSLEASFVKLGAEAAGDFNCYTHATIGLRNDILNAAHPSSIIISSRCLYRRLGTSSI